MWGFFSLFAIMINEEFINAYRSRKCNSFYNENPKAYDEGLVKLGEDDYNSKLNNVFEIFGLESNKYCGEEVSPYTKKKLNIVYPKLEIEEYIQNSKAAQVAFVKLDFEERFDLLKASLDLVSKRFFELAYATMHTTGQSFMMSFQASGPHAADRALEAMVAAYLELSTFNPKVDWEKDFGKFQLKIRKDFLPIPKGIGLVIGCSTFPTWNSVTGIYANLMCGNPVIVKPHPKAILPIAMFVNEIRRAAANIGLDPNIIQLATDTLESPITKLLAEHESVKLIDYTGGNQFGDYIESLKNKITFTEKAGVNCCIVDSANDINSVYSNIAFSASLYSGQMCTAPQNIFVPKDGVLTHDGKISFDEFVKGLATSIKGLVENPKAGPNTLGALQSEATAKRVKEKENDSGVYLKSIVNSNPSFENALVASPVIVVKDTKDYSEYSQECFGPILFIIKTENTTESISIAERLANEKGALTCLSYSTSSDMIDEIKSRMNAVFVPVSFNFSGAGFVNQHAAFSDLHVTGGNPAGNATFTNSEYVSKRFVWVGNRYM